MSVRTPLLRALHSALDEALWETAPRKLFSRRSFLKSSAATLALTALGGDLLAKQYSSHVKPRIAIVGAGIAGLTAAHYLRKSGLHATIYEGSSRSGGRIYTAHDLFERGHWTELGGEFIDSNHTDLLQIAKVLGVLHTIDREREEASIEEHTFFFGGLIRSQQEVLGAFRDLAPRIERDISSLPSKVNFLTANDATRALDRISLAEYLHSLGAERWITDLLDIAYLSEYATETGEQSALNFLTLINPTSSAETFAPYGESDERYKIYGGNSTITDSLAKRSHIKHGYMLTEIAERSSSYTLHFERANAATLEVTADIVIVTIPFSTLRNVTMSVPLPPLKEQAIRELGYGTPTKIILGMDHRSWREDGGSGYAMTDQPFQTGWDSTEGQPGRSASYTMFVGGDVGRTASGSADVLATKYLPGLDVVFPGSAKSFTGKAVKFNWSEYPFALGGYASYRPGQWTTFGGIEAEPIQNLFFAGEHCSPDFQGFMNGGAQSAKQTVARVLAKINK